MTTFSAVVTTGIYCRPGCGAKPLAENVRTFELAATAEAAGFRACLRCRPYRVASPVSPDADELVCRAVQLIIEGTLDGGTETALGARLAVSPRHLRRLFNEHLGLTPDQLARSRRAHFARRLLDDTDLNVAEVAFASGFGSLRQFNRDMREVFRASPRDLRARRRRTDRLATDGGLVLRLPYQQPYDWDGVLAFLAEGAVPGVEAVDAGVYRRTVSLDGGPGVLEVHPGGDGHLLLRAHLPYWEGLIHVVERAGRMVGVEVDPGPAARALTGDPILGPLVAARPGLRVPNSWGAFEAAVQAVLAQHLSPASARQGLAELVRRFGQPVPGLSHGMTHLFPAAEVLASAGVLGLDLAAAAATAVYRLACAVTERRVVLHSGLGLADLVAALTAVDGIAPSTAHLVALRLGHRDAFPAADPHLRRALHALNAPEPAGELAASWRPWRASAAVQLMAHGARLASDRVRSAAR